MTRVPPTVRRRVARAGTRTRGLRRRASHRVHRAAATLRTRTVRGEELGALLFGQQHLGSREFFEAVLGQAHTVPLSAFPHVAFLRDPDGGRAEFDDYLDQSWSYRRPKKNTRKARRRHMQRFLERKELVERGERAEEPALVYRRRDGRYVLVDGNHRAAIAYVLGQPLRLRVLSTRQWLSETVLLSGAFFGSGHRNMPYQSLFDRDRELVRGRRRDTVERIARIDRDDLVGRRVLDLGCNIGATVFAAADRGAAHVTGLEVDPRIVVSATRLNSYFGADVDFRVHDLDEPYHPTAPVDTLLCFSVAAHVRTLAGLEETIRAAAPRVMYFEGHAGTTADDYPTLLRADWFPRIDLLGHSGSGNPGSSERRPFYRCVATDA